MKMERTTFSNPRFRRNCESEDSLQFWCQPDKCENCHSCRCKVYEDVYKTNGNNAGEKFNCSDDSCGNCLESFNEGSRDALLKVIQIVLSENQYLKKQLQACKVHHSNASCSSRDCSNPSKLNFNKSWQTEASERPKMHQSPGNYNSKIATSGQRNFSLGKPEEKPNGDLRKMQEVEYCDMIGDHGYKKQEVPWMPQKSFKDRRKCSDGEKINNNRGKSDKSYKGKTLQNCKFCNKPHIWGASRCPAFGKTCRKCLKINHLTEACQNRKCKTIFRCRSTPTNGQHQQDAEGKFLKTKSQPPERVANKTNSEMKLNDLQEKSDSKKEKELIQDEALQQTDVTEADGYGNQAAEDMVEQQDAEGKFLTINSQTTKEKVGAAEAEKEFEEESEIANDKVAEVTSESETEVLAENKKNI